jgi:hypothetical protein
LLLEVEEKHNVSFSVYFLQQLFRQYCICIDNLLTVIEHYSWGLAETVEKVLDAGDIF